MALTIFESFDFLDRFSTDVDGWCDSVGSFSHVLGGTLGLIHFEVKTHVHEVGGRIDKL